MADPQNFPRPVDLMHFCQVAYDELTAQDAYPMLYAVDAVGNLLSCQIGFKLSRAYRALGAAAAETALMLRGLYVADPSHLTAMAEAEDFRRAPGLADGGIALFNGAGGELIGAVGVIATSSTGRAPDSRQVCELVRDVATAYRFGVSSDISTTL